MLQLAVYNTAYVEFSCALKTFSTLVVYYMTQGFVMQYSFWMWKICIVEDSLLL